MYNDFSKKGITNKKNAYIIGWVVGVLTTLVCMLLFSVILLLFNIDRAYSAPFATISVSLGGFIASKITAKKIGDKGYLIGAIIGIIIFAIITIISLALGNSISLNTLFHFIIIMLSSIVGGIMGVNVNKHKKYI